MSTCSFTQPGALTQTQTQVPEPHRSQLLIALPGIAHGLTYRVPGLGTAEGNIGYSGSRDRDEAWRMRQLWANAIGLDARNIVNVGQVHGNDIIAVGPDDIGQGAAPGSPVVGRADALMTDTPGAVLLTLGADCQPILLVDLDRPAIAAVHAGWRGTVADIAGNAVRAMVNTYRSNPARILAYLGPAISVASNEVGDEVIDAWREQAADLGADADLAVTRPGPKAQFDVPQANRLMLLRAGMRPENIEISSICTKIENDRWFSHRGQGAAAGRQGAMIAIRHDLADTTAEVSS